MYSIAMPILYYVVYSVVGQRTNKYIQGFMAKWKKAPPARFEHLWLNCISIAVDFFRSNFQNMNQTALVHMYN